MPATAIPRPASARRKASAAYDAPSRTAKFTPRGRASTGSVPSARTESVPGTRKKSSVLGESTGTVRARFRIAARPNSGS